MRNLFVKTALVLCTTIIFLPATVFATEPQNTEITSAEEGFTDSDPSVSYENDNSLTLDEKEDGDKKIFLSFKGKGDDVEITVRDNGLGMEQEKAETLVTYQAKGYGLKNVNDRIRLLYGENYGIHIFSSPDEGTTVIMKFPKEGRENEE